MKKKFSPRGFTLIEILVVIGIIAILAAVVIIAINPARQFAQARDSQRLSNINSILSAIGQNMADNKGITNCTGINLNATSTISSGVASGIADLRECLVPQYMAEIPVDPTAGTAYNGTSYFTGYSVRQDSNGRIHVIATTTEPNIPRTTQLEVTR